ncbi:hypothetical protein C7S16_6108 [Burkholderia thailandensis]|uniref:Uncharacterized protein n=1 Tax=Burkholderia thailandensis TaxID=57975 RepID=A0AAW9CP98_BURTH|nr:hypothetical protein [Burkholderia thailandensis]
MPVSAPGVTVSRKASASDDAAECGMHRAWPGGRRRRRAWQRNARQADSARR